jgi:RimJ/RimL family protein N-acetyltransferase
MISSSKIKGCEMKLVPLSRDDLDLFVSMFGDPEHMAELGGVHPLEKIPSILDKHIGYAEKGTSVTFKIVPTEEDLESYHCDLKTGEGVGTVCLWEGEFENQPVSEIGWGVATRYKGCGFATKAVRMLLELAKQSGRWGVIHAFTTVTNTPSNAMCARLGFSLLGECDIDYDGRPLRANHYTFNSSV